MQLAENPTAGPKGLELSSRIAPEAATRSRAQKEPVMGFSEIVDLGLSLDTEWAPDFADGSQMPAVTTWGAVTDGYAIKAEFFEINEEVESTGPELTWPTHVASDIPTQNLNHQAMVAETDLPTDFDAPDTSNLTTEGTVSGLEAHVPKLPESATEPELDADMQDGLAHPDGIGRAPVSPEQNSNVAHVLDARASVVSSRRNAAESGQVTAIQDPRLHEARERSLPRDARLDDAVVADETHSESRSEISKPYERTAETSSRTTQNLNVPPIQPATMPGMAQFSNTQSVERESGLPEQHETPTLVAPSDHARHTSADPTVARTIAPLSVDLQAKNMQNIRETLVNLRHDGSVEIAVDPPEFGRIKMAMSGHEHQMSVVVSVDRPEVLDMIRRHIDMLKTELMAQGYTQLNFDFRRNDRESNFPGAVTEDNNSSGENTDHMIETTQAIRLPNGRMDIRI